MGLPQNRDFSIFVILWEPGIKMVMRWPFDTIRWLSGEAIGAIWGNIGTPSGGIVTKLILAWGHIWVHIELLQELLSMSRMHSIEVDIPLSN